MLFFLQAISAIVSLVALGLTFHMFRGIRAPNILWPVRVHLTLLTLFLSAWRLVSLIVRDDTHGPVQDFYRGGWMSGVASTVVAFSTIVIIVFIGELVPTKKKE